ncbi:MAG: imidazole glycerol phosphate synthase subunit HisH [Planctomycetes bacterium]|nr:imidazole glycerol phosphate synthase subunit HisH [Planctomycetota bacterium]
MPVPVTILDSQICNLASIARALERAGGSVTVAQDAAAIKAASRLVLPGVGSFPAAMRAFNQRGLSQPLRDFAKTGKPMIGVCLGMQLLMEIGEEFEQTPGLGIVPGRVRAIQAKGLAIPHMGWNAVEVKRVDPLLNGLQSGDYLYFVHSFVCEPQYSGDVLCTTEYGERFCSLLRRGNVWGVQAHPEKSQRAGAALLKNFLELAP